MIIDFLKSTFTLAGLQIPFWVLIAVVLVLFVIVVAVIVSKRKNDKNTKQGSIDKQQTIQTAYEKKEPQTKVETFKPAAKSTNANEKAAVAPTKEKPEEKEELKPLGKFEVLLKADGYRFYLVANNGQLLYESTGYTTANGAVKGIDTFKRAVEKGNFIVDEDKFGRFRFILNKRYAGENYTSKAQCESSIESVKNFSARAVITPYQKDEAAEKEYARNNNNKEINIIDWDIIAEKEKTIKKSGKFEIVKCSAGYCFYLIANNGQLLYSSNSYASASSAKDAIKNFKKTVYGGNFVIDEDKFGRHRFILKGGNFYATYIGESYTTKNACENNINSVKNFTKSAAMPE